MKIGQRLYTLLVLLGIMAVFGTLYVYLKRKQYEGFTDNGTLPTTAESMIPSDTAGSTGSDPTRSKPQPRDILATLESIKNYTLLQQSMSPDRSDPTLDMNAEANLHTALSNPEQSDMTVSQVSQIRQAYERASNTLRNKTVTTATPSGVISLNDLKTLQTRIQEEIKRLANLRSSSATLTARKTQLEKLNADVEDIRSSVERGQMKPEDIPIQADDASAFLKNLQSGQSSILIQPTPQTGKKQLPMSSVTNTEGPQGSVSTPAISSLLQTAQNLKWSVRLNVEFDPAVEQRNKIVERLESLEKRLTDLAVSKTPLPKDVYASYLNELRSIHLRVGNPSSKEPSSTRHVSTSSNDSVPYTQPEYPSVAQQKNAQDDGMSSFPKAGTSQDNFIRPGFVMNDETIARRASASAFDTRTVGGPDYKQRAQELCRQVQSAQLGDPANFGCIANPDTVGANYSWKGNYTMVCNRIGDTWGGFYPEMFGCPKYDPAKKFMSS